jgi:hypothetical protein
VELEPRRPIFEKCSHFREKGGVLTEIWNIWNRLSRTVHALVVNTVKLGNRTFGTLRFLSSSAVSSKIKIRTFPRHKTKLTLWRDEVQILIFDDLAELEKPQRPVLEDFGG